MADIQTEAWAAWLAEYGVDAETIKANLASDSDNSEHLDAREERLRQAFQRNSDNEAVLYVGGFASGGDMVGFAKFLLSQGDVGLDILLAEIDVLPEYQGKDVANPADRNMAKRMIYSVLAQITHPQTTLRLKVLAGNVRARALYEKLGMEVVDDSSGFAFEGGEERVIHEQPHLIMQGSAVVARNRLREMVSN